MKFEILGNIADTSGYSSHTRGLFNALSKVADVKLTSQVPAGFERELTDRELNALKKKEDDRIRIIITNPTYWKIHATGKRNWCFLVFEGDRIPKSWLDECLNPEVEYILVPSNHTKQAIENTVNEWEGTEQNKILDKIKIIPHGIDLDKFYPKDKPEKFTFICNKGLRNLQDRGGIQYVLQAYMEEFSSKEDVDLLVKINPAYGQPDLVKIVDPIKPNKQDLPGVRFTANPVPFDSLVNLYNTGHVFVSATRSEAFNIPCLEGMACGLPNICTGYGGQTDFIKDGESGWYIDYKMTEVTWELLYEGISWATPDIADLRKKMRWCFENKDKVKEMGDKAREVSLQYTWDKSAEKLLTLVDR